MAMMRYVRASLAIERGDGERERSWIRDAIVHLGMLPASNSTWANALTTLRAELRKRTLRDRGLEVRHHGPADETGVLDAVMAIKLATEQAQEDEMSPVVSQENEEGLNDVLWNAVVAGHPNRFEDTIEASAYAGIVARKLVARGFVAQQAAPVAHPMLTGLLWWLWSSQNPRARRRAAAPGADPMTCSFQSPLLRPAPPSIRRCQFPSRTAGASAPSSSRRRKRCALCRGGALRQPGRLSDGRLPHSVSGSGDRWRVDNLGGSRGARLRRLDCHTRSGSDALAAASGRISDSRS